MNFLADITGAAGTGMQNGAGEYSAPANKRVAAIAIHTASEITNYKYTPEKKGRATTLTEITVTDEDWMALSLEPTGATSFISFSIPADKVTLAGGSGIVFMLLTNK